MKRVIITLSLLFSFAVSMVAGTAAGVFLDINPVIAGVSLFVGSNLLAAFVPQINGLPVLLFAAPGGIGTAFAANFKSLQENLTWNDAAAPILDLRIETQEDGVILEMVAASIAAYNGFMVQGAQVANDVLLRVADGALYNKNVTITGHTSAAGAINFYGDSDNKGKVPFRYLNAQILALEPQVFKKFTAISVPAMAAGDTCEVLYSDGHRQVYEAQELIALSARYQQVPGIILNNIDARIKQATFTCAAAHPAYIFNYVLPPAAKPAAVKK